MTKEITIWHNPRCSKSRQTLALLEENGAEVNIRRYLDDPPDEATLREVLARLDIAPRDLLRKGEKIYKELGLKDQTLSDIALIEAMVNHPILIERPVVITDKAAAIGRPPSNVLDLL